MEEDFRFTDERKRGVVSVVRPPFFVTGGEGERAQYFTGVRTLPPLVGAQTQRNIFT